MRLWMRRLFVAIIAVITLGQYVPEIEIDSARAKAKDSENIYDNSYDSYIYEEQTTESEQIVETAPIEEHVQLLTEKAKEQIKVKLGPKILSEIETDVVEVIFPKIQSILEETFYNQDEDLIPYYEITENPSKGTGERIFNVYDHHSKQIIAKFHVRRDQRPLEGYWFNFHYHIYEDDFEKHYEIAEVYWDKNDPPNWMSS